MQYNAQAVAATRSARDQKLRQTFRGNRVQLPWVRLSQLDDGQLRVRFWPGDDKKNPFGIFRYRKHTVEKVPGGKGVGKYETFLCPRSYHLHPMPTHWEDEQGNVSQVPAEGFEPEFKERCAACEILKAAEPVFKQLPQGLHDALSWLSGDDDYYIQATIVGGITSRTSVPRNDGNGTYEQTTFGPDHTGQTLTHVMFVIPDGYSIMEKMLALFGQCPDFANVQFGRWFTIMKQNKGSGTGGYDIMCDPNPSPAGFEIPENLYQDFSKWGKGGKKASLVMPYAAQEAHIASSPILAELRQWGIPLTDAEAEGGQAVPQLHQNPMAAFQPVGQFPQMPLTINNPAPVSYPSMMTPQQQFPAFNVPPQNNGGFGI